MIRERNEMLDELKENLCRMQDKMKKQANKGRREAQYIVNNRQSCISC